MIIDLNQTGFMAHKANDIDLRLLFSNIDVQHLNVGSRVVVSLDIGNTFETIEWPFLWEVLRRMSFPLVFIK